MLKHIAIVGLLSAAMLGAVQAPASAAFSPADCAYAKKMLQQGAGNESDHSGYNYYANVLEQCHS